MATGDYVYKQVSKTLENARAKHRKANPQAQEQSQAALQALRDNTYYAAAGKPALLREFVALKKRVGELTARLSEAERELAEEKEKRLRAEAERDDAIQRVAQLESHAKLFCD